MLLYLVDFIVFEVKRTFQSARKNSFQSKKELKYICRKKKLLLFFCQLIIETKSGP